MSNASFVTKLRLQGFKSFQDETVVFNNPLILVGRNDTGKTNFIEAFAFLADCMSSPLPSVIESRGGFGKLSCVLKSGTFADLPISVRVDFVLENGRSGYYAFSIGHPSYYADQSRRSIEMDYAVLHEQCFSQAVDGTSLWFENDGWTFQSNIEGIKPNLQLRSLALPIVGGVEEFAPVFTALSNMRVYAIDPKCVGAVQEQSGISLLKRDGSNIASILQNMAKNDSHWMERVRELLNSVVPNISRIDVISQPDHRLALSLTQELPNREGYLPFFGSSLANGTLYALGLLAALMQDPAPSLIALEEPELYIHPGAIGAISDWIEIAAKRTQIVVTTHSTELIDTKWIKPENLRIVQKTYGSHISRIGEAPSRMLQQHLTGAGELLRANALDAATDTDTSLETQMFEKITV